MKENKNEIQQFQIERDGKVIDCELLFTFDSPDTGKSYIGYTDNTIASNGRKNIYVSAYNPFNPDDALEDITDERELEMVNDVLMQIDEESR